MLKIRQFLWFCSGVNQQKLSNFPDDWNKYQSIGATVFLTACMASLTAGYAFYAVFGSLYIAIALGIFWGIVVLNLDRYIILSLKLPVSKLQQFSFFTYFAVFPRLLLAILLGFTIAVPFELRLFDQEIKQQLIKNLNQTQLAFDKQSAERQAIDKANKEFESKTEIKEYNTLLAEKNQLEKEYVKEVQGLSGTKKYGDGPASKAIKNRLNQIKGEIATIEKKYLIEKYAFEKELDIKKKHFENGKASLLEVNKIDSGFLQKIVALDQISSQSPIVRTVTWFIRLLIIILECAPMLVKLFSKTTAYELNEALELEKAETNFNVQWINLHENELKQGTESIKKVENHLTSTSLFGSNEINQNLKNFLNSRLNVFR